MGNKANFSCQVGRWFDASHPTCVSCVKQLGPCGRKVKKSRGPVPVRIWYHGAVFVCTKYLYSLNYWHGKARHVYSRYRKEWETVLAGTWALWGKADGKRSLLVRRYVAYEKDLVCDRDNLVGALKPVKDVLVRSGVLLDDTDELVEFDIQQAIDRGNPRVEIEVRPWPITT